MKPSSLPPLPRDARGAELYEEDEVIDLAKGPLARVRILRILDGGKVLLSTGVTTRANRVEYVG